MGEVLYIKANAKPEGMSRTFKVSDVFIDEYKKAHPSDNIVVLDLYREGIHPLTADDINNIFGPKNEESKNNPILKYAYQFAGADKYVVAAPMWNLSIPSILKAYIDYVSVSGITFKYTEQGPVGLCTGKKALHITARGGQYSEGIVSSFEMGDRYLRSIFAFFGITDFTTISAESLDIMGSDVEKILSDAITKAKDTAKKF